MASLPPELLIRYRVEPEDANPSPDPAPTPPVPPTPVKAPTGDVAPSAPLRPLAPVNVAPAVFRRRRPVPSADELSQGLLRVKEIELEKTFRGPVAQGLVVHTVEHQNELVPPPAPALLRLAEAGFPMRMGLGCRLGKDSTEALHTYSRSLRESLGAAKADAEKANKPIGPALRRRLQQDADHLSVPAAVPALVQILQAEAEPVRLALVELLANTKGLEAGKALARRAVFDQSAEVRESAVRALRGRPSSDYQDFLFEGLRHPWPAAAEFAAEALVNLGDASAIPRLIRLLDEPSPSAPTTRRVGDHEEHVVREMVRVNHLRNCLMCHSPSLRDSELVRAAAPDPKQPVPESVTPAYYQADPRALFVRGDITYLRQDFSLAQPVASPGKWPAFQRYDYVVRSRPLSAQEWAARPRKAKSYSQKDSTLYALRELSGRDYGDTSGDWWGYLLTEVLK